MKDNEKLNKKGKLKKGDEEKEDLNNRNSIDEYIKKEVEMAKKRCKTGYRRSGKKCVRRTPSKKSVRKAKFKWW